MMSLKMIIFARINTSYHERKRETNSSLTGEYVPVGAACDRRGEGGAEQQLRPEELRKQKRLLLQLFHKRLQTFCSIGRGDRLSAVVQVDKDVFVMAHAQLFHVG